ncbi:MAG: cysteine synthase A [Firmicutes bacterium]|uniref:Cysteine synthase n=1 Tax=Candidatus Scatoplasma merdavium TaxID=2840932 RepID=A0A9D9D819_9BACL|nr:cysteine synthase A [Candidatus Scatoplasma merdavium]
MIYENIIQTIGKTPLVHLSKIEKEFNLPFNLYGKVERFNPTGSIKDRAAYSMIEKAIKRNEIDKNTVIVEPTSGNTGIGLAMICAYLDMQCEIYMPSSASKERVKMMQAYGAKVILTDKSLGMKGAEDAAEKRLKEIPNSFMPSQFSNLDNPLAHYETTGREILNDLNNKVDYLVAGFGTGGTISGIAHLFKKENINCKFIGAEPLSSPLLTKGKAGPHLIQGIGANFIPECLDCTILDKIVDISDEDSYKFTSILAKKEGILAGISSGCALKAAIDLKEEYKEKGNVVVIFPDNGERYLSVEGLYE